MVATAPVESSDQHIFILSVDGSQESDVVKGVGMNHDPVWTSDGRHVLFISDRSGATVDLWALTVRDGKAAGESQLVDERVGNLTFIGKTHSESYYYDEFRAGG